MFPCAKTHTIFSSIHYPPKQSLPIMRGLIGRNTFIELGREKAGGHDPQGLFRDEDNGYMQGGIAERLALVKFL